MAEIKQREKKKDATDLWNDPADSITLKSYAENTVDTEKLLVFSETGGGKTTFYLQIIHFLKKKQFPPEKFLMMICYPDRPSGISKLFNLIPPEYKERIDIFPVSTYEDTIRATSTIVNRMDEHFKKTGVHGWAVFELMENYWTFCMDYYCRKAYGETMADFFTEMQANVGEGKAEKKSSFESFAGPFGGPWPAIKFHHNFNWIDKLKRLPFNIVFTSEIKQEDNADSIFSELGHRPAGEKHNQHKMDTILYLSHKKIGKDYKHFMKPFKLTGYTALYANIDITHKNGYEEHIKAIKELEKRGYKVGKIKDIEKQAGITPPKPKPTEQPKAPEPKKEEKPKETKSEEPPEDVWEI
jgi:hypothetical protein